MRIQLGTKPLTRQHMEELRSILVDLQVQLDSIVERIPEATQIDISSNTSNRSWSFSRSPTEALSVDLTLPGDAAPTCVEQYHTPVLASFHKWARIILRLYADKVSKVITTMSDQRITGISGILCCISTLPQECEKPGLASCKTKVCAVAHRIFHKLTSIVHFVTATGSWRNSSPLLPTPISSLFSGVGLGTTSQCMQP